MYVCIVICLYIYKRISSPLDHFALSYLRHCNSFDWSKRREGDLDLLLGELEVDASNVYSALEGEIALVCYSQLSLLHYHGLLL